jgi:hypothetical protein
MVLQKELTSRVFATPDLRMNYAVRIDSLKDTFIYWEILYSDGIKLQVWSLFWRLVIWWISTDVSKKSAASIFRTENSNKLIIDAEFSIYVYVYLSPSCPKNLSNKFSLVFFLIKRFQQYGSCVWEASVLLNSLSFTKIISSVAGEYEVNKEHLWNDSGKGNPKYSDRKLSHCHTAS